VQADSRPSRTAYRVALRRAQHQLIDRPRVLDDPIAIPIVGADAVDALPDAPWDRFLRAFMVARSRFAEDALGDAVAAGVRQYVVLGAGLDTFAYRNPHAGLRVFEVDHPATQAWKRERLAAAQVPLPDTLTFAAVDFEHDTLADGLARAGFDAGAPSFFSWLGVVPYLTRDAIERTLAYIGARPARSGVVFDYAPDAASLSPQQRIAVDALAARVAAAGEPFQSAFEPRDLDRAMRRAGFSTIEDVDASAINARYFSDRTDGLRVGGVGRLMRGVV